MEGVQDPIELNSAQISDMAQASASGRSSVSSPGPSNPVPTSGSDTIPRNQASNFCALLDQLDNLPADANSDVRRPLLHRLVLQLAPDPPIDPRLSDRSPELSSTEGSSDDGGVPLPAVEISDNQSSGGPFPLSESAFDLLQTLLSSSVTSVDASSSGDSSNQDDTSSIFSVSDYDYLIMSDSSEEISDQDDASSTVSSDSSDDSHNQDDASSTVSINDSLIMSDSSDSETYVDDVTDSSTLISSDRSSYHMGWTPAELAIWNAVMERIQLFRRMNDLLAERPHLPWVSSSRPHNLWDLTNDEMRSIFTNMDEIGAGVRDTAEMPREELRFGQVARVPHLVIGEFVDDDVYLEASSSIDEDYEEAESLG